MPYVRPDVREELQRRSPVNGAELNYLVLRAANQLFRDRGGESEASYADRSEIHAALLGAAREFERTKIDPYEERKRLENGDV